MSIQNVTLTRGLTASGVLSSLGVSGSPQLGTVDTVDLSSATARYVAVEVPFYANSNGYAYPQNDGSGKLEMIYGYSGGSVTTLPMVDSEGVAVPLDSTLRIVAARVTHTDDYSYAYPVYVYPTASLKQSSPTIIEVPSAMVNVSVYFETAFDYMAANNVAGSLQIYPHAQFSGTVLVELIVDEA